MRYQLLAACLTGVVFGVPSLSHAAPTYQVLHDFKHLLSINRLVRAHDFRVGEISLPVAVIV